MSTPEYGAHDFHSRVGKAKVILLLRLHVESVNGTRSGDAELCRRYRHFKMSNQSSAKLTKVVVNVKKVDII